MSERELRAADSKGRLLSFVPHLRHAFAQAALEGVPQLAVVASRPDGGGRVVSRFDGVEFLTDLCGTLGVPVENTEDETLDAAAVAIVSLFGPVRGEAAP